MAKRKPGAADVDKDAMEAAGFAFDAAPAPEDGRLRVEAMSVEGWENAGKTSFALSASEFGPTAYIRMDSGSGIMEGYRRAGREIADLQMIALLSDEVESSDLAAVSEAMEPKLQELKVACRKVIESRVPYCVIDTGGALEDLVGYALNGKVSINVRNGEGKLRKAVNQAMSSLFRLFESAPDTSLIMTHRLGEYDDRIYPIGWKAINYEVPYVVRCEYACSKEDDPDSPKKFYARIIKSKYRKELEGTRHRVDALTGYGKIAKMLLPPAPGADEEED